MTLPPPVHFLGLTARVMEDKREVSSGNMAGSAASPGTWLYGSGRGTKQLPFLLPTLTPAVTARPATFHHGIVTNARRRILSEKVSRASYSTRRTKVMKIPNVIKTCNLPNLQSYANVIPVKLPGGTYACITG